GHLPSDEVERIRSWADQLGDRATTRALELIGDALLAMRQAPDPRIPLEVALVKITRAEAGADLAALTERVARLESALAAGAAAPAPASPGASSGSGAPAGSGAPSASGAPAPQARPASEPAPGGSGRPAPPPVPGRPASRAAAAREALARSGRS